MPTTESKFLKFWRAVDADLALLDEKPASAGEASREFPCEYTAGLAARNIKAARHPVDFSLVRRRGKPRRPNNTRGAGRESGA